VLSVLETPSSFGMSTTRWHVQESHSLLSMCQRSDDGGTGYVCWEHLPALVCLHCCCCIHSTYMVAVICHCQMQACPRLRHTCTHSRGAAWPSRCSVVVATMQVPAKCAEGEGTKEQSLLVLKPSQYVKKKQFALLTPPYLTNMQHHIYSITYILMQ